MGEYRLHATCSFCAWEAKHEGDDPVETADFLRRRLIAHAEEHHADKIDPEKPVEQQVTLEGPDAADAKGK